MSRQRFDRDRGTSLVFTPAMLPSDPERRAARPVIEPMGTKAQAEAPVPTDKPRPLRHPRPSQSSSAGGWEAFDEAWTMVAELISAVVTWAGVGWLLDRWLDTAPWLLLIGILIGSATGFYLVLLRSNRMWAKATMPGRTVAGGSADDGNTTEGASSGKGGTD